jgi:hypothetical protein
MASRQYAWQQKMRKEGRCVLCGIDAKGKVHCPKHAKRDAEKSKARRQKRIDTSK